MNLYIFSLSANKSEYFIKNLLNINLVDLIGIRSIWLRPDWPPATHSAWTVESL